MGTGVSVGIGVGVAVGTGVGVRVGVGPAAGSIVVRTVATAVGVETRWSPVSFDEL